MAQYITGQARVLSSNHQRVELVGGSTSAAGLVAGRMFLFQGENVPWIVASVINDTTFDLSANYVGDRAYDTLYPYVLVSDYTATLGLPLINNGDKSTAQIFSRAMQILDTQLASIAGAYSPGLHTTTGKRYFGVKGTTKNGVVELSTVESDGDAVTVGEVQFADKWSSGEKRVATIAVRQSGTTGANRGGLLAFGTKGDAGSLVEHVFLNRDGHLLVGSPGSMAPLGTVAGRRIVSVWGTTGAGVVELGTNEAEALGQVLGAYQYVSKNASGTKILASIAALSAGASAGDRGGAFQFYTKANAGALTARMRLDEQGRLAIGGALSPTSVLHLVGDLQVVPSADAVAADTASYAPFGVTRKADPSNPLTYIALTRSGAAVTGLGMDVRGNLAFGVPVASTQVLTIGAVLTPNAHWLIRNAPGNPDIADMPAGQRVAVYLRGSKIVFATNVGGVMKYLSADLSLVTPTWSTTTP